MKRILFFISIVLLFSSCTLPDSAMDYFDENPFINPKRIESDSSTMVFFTDAHIGRENHKKGVKRYEKELLSFISSSSYCAVVSGGDMADDGEVSKELYDFVQNLIDKSNLYIETIGNHDRHGYAYKAGDIVGFFNGTVLDNTHSTYADSLYSSDKINTTGCYVIVKDGKDFISLYVLDTALRALSPKGLKWLEEALNEDDTPYKIVISHDNILTGGVLDHSLFLTGYGDEGEIGRLIEILNKGKVSLVLSGHHHKGNILYGDGSGYTEFNGAALHGTDSVFENTGWWYTVEIKEESGTIEIVGYDAASSDAKKRWNIKAKV